MRRSSPVAILVLSVATACTVDGAGGAERRYTTAGSSDDPSEGTAILADGRVAYELTAWHFTDGTHVDAIVRNHGPGTLTIDPSRATLRTAAGEEVAATPAGCGVCESPAALCPRAAAAAAVKVVPPGGTARVVRCFAAVNPWEGRHQISGADPKRLALTFRDEGLALDGAPLVAEVELIRR